MMLNILSAIYTSVFCLNLDDFLYSNNKWFEPKYWMLLFLAISVYILIKSDGIKKLATNNIFYFLLMYLFFSAIWYFGNNNSSSRLYGVSLLQITAVLLLSSVIIFNCIGDTYRGVTVGLFFSLVIGGASVVAEQLYPEFFYGAGMSIIGRPAGLYLNPNSAGIALLIITAVLIPRISKKYIMYAIWISFIGIVMSFSRGALLGWALILIFSVYFGYLHRYNLYIVGAIYATIVIFSNQALYIFELFLGNDQDYSNILDRFSWFVGNSDLQDSSYDERKYISNYAWDFFWSNPIFGNGLGFTWGWGVDVNTHNLFLRHIVEYGVFGLIFIPTLLYSIYVKNSSINRKWMLSVFILIVVQCFFSHNIFEVGFFLIPLVSLQQPRYR